jgi:plastocyanin
MKHIKLVQIVFIVIILSSFSAGCLEAQNGTPATTPGAKVQETTEMSTPSITSTETARIPSLYIIYLDDYSFYKVMETSHKIVEYQNFTLTINVGDTVEWRNNADYNDILTLVSVEGLWDSADLRAKLMNNKGFNYTFAKSGTYIFRVKEEPKILPQTIIVKP